MSTFHAIELCHRLGHHLWRGLGANRRTDVPRQALLEGVEIGVYKAELSKILLGTFPGLRLHLVDWWNEYPPGDPYRHSGDVRSRRSQTNWDRIYHQVALDLHGYLTKQRAFLHRCRSADAAAKVPDKSLDFVFIDGDHSGRGVREDISLWLPKIKLKTAGETGGLLGGHDYGNPLTPEVKPAVDGSAAALGYRVETGVGFTWFFVVP